MGCLSRQRHGCHCSRAQMETAQEGCKWHMKKWACAASRFLPFLKDFQCLTRFLKQISFIKEPGQNRELNLSLWEQQRPGLDSDVQDLPNSTSISFLSCEIFCLFATAEVFHYLLGFSPLLPPFSHCILLLSHSTSHFFRLFTFLIYYQHAFPCLFFHKVLLSSLMYIKVCRKRENVILSNCIQVDVKGVSYGSHLASFAANREKDK